MSTRSMTIVKQTYDGDGKFVPLYRHCDGYPAVAGAAIVQALLSAPTDCEGVVAGLLAQRYTSEHEDRDETVYRLAHWQPEGQGDLEHVYQVEPSSIKDANGFSVRSPIGGWTVKHYIRGRWTGGSDDYRQWPAKTYTLAEFVAVVNKDRSDINAMIKARSLQAEGYPMLQAVQP